MNLKTAQMLFLLNGLIWLLFGIISLLRLEKEGNGGQTAVFIIIALFMFGNAVAMLLAAWAIGKQRKASFFFALAVLSINIILTFADQFGSFDLLTLIIDLLILGILIAKRERFVTA